MLPGVDERPRGFDRRGDDVRHVDVLDPQGDLALRDARDVQQVVDQVAQQADLAGDYVPGPGEPFRIHALLVHDVEGVRNRA